MEHEEQKRCINLDWLEVYCFESRDRFPCNARYFEKQGYIVKEREYGTRVYKEMFTILDDNGNPVMEVRRCPASGDASFSGLVPESCHLRLPNWMLYQGNPARYMMEFLLKHDYVFQSIYRIDIAYDFVLFDSGDKPDRFVRRYLEGQYRKINQCFLSAHGEDSWNNCNWNSLSWGSRTSMVGTKLYNKTKELMEGKTDKPYIRTAWMLTGLVDNPVSLTKRQPDGSMKQVDVWRLEYSLKSSCKGWIVIEIEDGKKVKKQHIPHRLSMFDAKDKLWQRFQDLTYHYFRFKYKEYVDLAEKSQFLVLETANSDYQRPLKRKDRCRDKKLFYFDAGHQFTKVSNCPPDYKSSRKDDVLERRLRHYQMTHSNLDIRRACQIILDDLDLNKVINYTPTYNILDARVLQETLRRKMGGDERDVAELLNSIAKLIHDGEIF